MSKSKERIIKDVSTQLAWDSRVESVDVNVNVSDGKVILSGTVPHFSARLAAEDDARSVRGVNSVSNLITVAIPPGVKIPEDSELKTNVERILLINDDIDSTKIQVSVSNGVVTLGGTQDTFYKKVKTVNKVSELTGVLDVNDNIAVVPTKDVVDKVIAEDITTAIRRFDDLLEDNINVIVKNGVVTLTGQVRDWNAYNHILSIVMYTGGILDIVDRLTIQQEEKV